MIKGILLSSLCTFGSVLLAGGILDSIENGYLLPILPILIITLIISGGVFGSLFSRQKSHILIIASSSILFSFLLYVGYILFSLTFFGK